MRNRAGEPAQGTASECSGLQGDGEQSKEQERTWPISRSSRVTADQTGTMGRAIGVARSSGKSQFPWHKGRGDTVGRAEAMGGPRMRGPAQGKTDGAVGEIRSGPLMSQEA